jgi:uncharacterized protein YcbK (DUF882 family)
LISIDGQNSGRDDNGNGWKNWFAGALCFAGLMAGTVAAEAQTRTLKLMNVHTGEKAEVTYRRGSSYDSAGLKKANYILRDWRKNQPIRMNPKALDVLWRSTATLAPRVISTSSAGIARRLPIPCCAAAVAALRRKAST